MPSILTLTLRIPTGNAGTESVTAVGFKASRMGIRAVTGHNRGAEVGAPTGPPGVPRWSVSCTELHRRSPLRGMPKSSNLDFAGSRWGSTRPVTQSLLND